MAYKDHKVLCEQLRSLNFHRKVSVNNFKEPNFELVSEILKWATTLTEDGNENLPKEIDTEAQRVLLIRSYAKFFCQHLSVHLNTKNLYAAQTQAVPELLKVTGPLYKAHQQAQNSLDQLQQDDDQEIDSSDPCPIAKAKELSALRQSASDVIQCAASLHQQLNGEPVARNSVEMNCGKRMSAKNPSGVVIISGASKGDDEGGTVDNGKGEYLKMDEDEELDESYVEEEALEEEEIEEEEEEDVEDGEEEESDGGQEEQSEADEDDIVVKEETDEEEDEEVDNSVDAKKFEESGEIEESFNTDGEEAEEEESEGEEEHSEAEDDEMEVEEETDDENQEVDNSLDAKEGRENSNLEESGEIEESFNTDEDETDTNDESEDDEEEEDEKEEEGDDGLGTLSIIKHIKDILNQEDHIVLSKENLQNKKDVNKKNVIQTKGDVIDDDNQEKKSENDEDKTKCKDKDGKEGKCITESEDEASQTESLLAELSFLNESCAKQSSYRTPRKTRKQFNDSLNASLNSIFSPLENLLHSKKKESMQKKKRKLASPSPNKYQKGVKKLKFNGDEDKDIRSDLIMDEDSQDGKLTIDVVPTPSPRKRNSKVSPDKSSKQKKSSDSEELPQEVIELLQSGIDDMLEEKAQKTHLTAIHVKNIIKTVMTDKNVLSMVRNTVYGSQEETFMPKLTRAKMKELCNQELGPINMWAGLQNYSPGNFETQALVCTDFPDEDEDEEYNPDKDSQVASDDESFLSARGSEFSSCQNTPTTPSTPKSSIYNPTTPHSNSTQGTPSLKRIQMLRTGSAKKKASVQRSLDFEKMMEDGSYNRTRSKHSFIDTPLETLEMAFKPPDVTAGMYETECEDEEWTNFLNDYIQPLNTLDGQEEEEEADPEYIYFDEDKLDDEAIENAAEEFRHDRASRISKKEYNTLINDLLDSFDPGSDDESPSKPSQFLNPNDICKFPVTPKICQRKNGQDEKDAPEDAIWVEVMTPQFSASQLEVLRCQMNQHVQLLCTSAVMCHGQPSLSNISEHCTNYLNELQSSSLSSPSNNSYYNTQNLSDAFSTIEAIQKITINRADETLPQGKKTDKKSKAKGKAEIIKKLQIPSDMVDVILSSKVFLYPQYLPVRMFHDPTEKKTNKANNFLLSEDILLAAGLHLYLEKDEKNRLKNFKLMKDALAKISYTVLITKSVTQLQTRIKNLRNRNDPNNPVIQYFKDGSFELPQAMYEPLPPFAGCPVSQFNLNLLDEAWREELNERKCLANQDQPITNDLSLNNNIVIIRGADGSMQVILPPSSNTTVISPQKGSVPIDMAHSPCAPMSAITCNNSTILPQQQDVIPNALPTSSLSSANIFNNSSVISSQNYTIPISLPPYVPISSIPPLIPTQNGAQISIPPSGPVLIENPEISSQSGSIPIYIPPYTPSSFDASIMSSQNSTVPISVPPSDPIPTTVQGNIIDNGSTQGIINDGSLVENYTEIEHDTNAEDLTINSSFESFLKSPLSKKNICEVKQKLQDLNVDLINKDKMSKADESNIEYSNTSEMEMEIHNNKFPSCNITVNDKLVLNQNNDVTPDRSQIGVNVGKTPRRDKISIESTSSEDTNGRDIPISPSSSMDINASPLRSIFDTPISKGFRLVPYPVSPSPESRSSFYGIVPPNITTPTPKCPSSVKVLGLSNLNLSPVGGETPVLSDYFNIAPSSPGSTLNTPEKLQVKMRGRGIAALLTTPGKPLVPVTSVTITAYPVFTNITGGGRPPKDNGGGNKGHGDSNRGVDSGIENSYPPSPADHDESDGPESVELQSSSNAATGSDLQTSPVQASGSGNTQSSNVTFVTSVYDGPILTAPPIVNQPLEMPESTTSITFRRNPTTPRPIAAKPWSPHKGSPRKSSPLKQVSPILRKYRKMSPHKKLSPTFRKLQPVLPKTSPLKHKRRLLAPKPTLSMTLSTSQIGSLSKQTSNILNVSENLLHNEKETEFSSSESVVSQLNENVNVGCSPSHKQQQHGVREIGSREEPDDFEEDSLGEDEDDDDDDESAQQQEDHLAALLKASSTITGRVRGNDSTARKGDHLGQGERRLNKQQRRLQARITALSTTMDNFTQSKVYAQSYMARVRELLLDKDPTIFQEFLSILNKFNCNESSPVDLYKRLCDLLSDFPYLAEEFIAFLQPHQAIELGKYDKYCTIHRMMDFLEKLELQFNPEPVHFQKIVRVLQNLSVSKDELSLEEVKTSMAAVLRYPHLVEAFTQCFPQEPPPPSLQTDFEEIDLDAPGSPDSDELITLPEYELPCTPNSPERCTCQCHATTSSTATSHITSAPQPTQHCQSCAIRFSEGRVFLQCGKTLRPAKVIYHVQKKEEKDETVEAGTDGKGKKGVLGDSLGQKKEVSTSCGTDKKYCTKIKVDDLIGRKDNPQLKDNIPKNVTTQESDLGANPTNKQVLFCSPPKEIHNENASIGICSSAKGAKTFTGVLDFEKTSDLSENSQSDNKSDTFKAGCEKAMDAAMKTTEMITSSASSLSSNIAESSTTVVSNTVSSKTVASKKWTVDEDRVLLTTVQVNGNPTESVFHEISQQLTTRSPKEVQDRFNYLISLMCEQNEASDDSASTCSEDSML